MTTADPGSTDLAGAAYYAGVDVDRSEPISPADAVTEQEWAWAAELLAAEQAAAADGA